MVALCIVTALVFVACGTPNNTGTPEQPSLLEITGVAFESAEYDYDGTEKTLAVTGELPQGVSVSYTGNKGTNAGTYNAKATLSGDGYMTKEFTAALTINKVEITGIVFNGDTVEYDSKPHSIQITGNLPQGVTAKYYYDGAEASGISEVGKHEVKCVMTGNNHITKELTATLTIKATEEQLFCAALNGTVYFQNALDGKKLYAAGNSGLRKVSNDTPRLVCKHLVQAVLFR